MDKIELLAPVGSYEALIAAVQNGADAVYLGGKYFGARAYAENFDMETMEKAIDYAHIRGVKVYITINTLIKDQEILELVEYVSKLYIMGIDAVIVQDLGILSMIKNIFPDLDIHCSTQMALHNTSGIHLLEKVGVNRVVLARELSIENIKTIRKNTKVDIEVFVHGALCYCYSGLCFMSSFIGGRSGNRGRCAQPCRKKYDIVALHNLSSRTEKAHYISTRDLITIDKIGEIIESGVQSLKIEGRMKKPQYVASVVRAYRKAIDMYLSQRESLIDEGTLKEITQIFNRKFTKGYILNTSPKELINPEMPNNRGLFLGRIEKYDEKQNKFKIKILEDIQQGDGIEILGKSLEAVGGIINRIYKENKVMHKAEKGETIEIEFAKKVEKGAMVYKTLDQQLMKELEKTYRGDIENKKIEIWGQIKAEIGMPLKLYIWDIDGNTVYKESQEMIEKARTVALQKEKLLENIKKVGNTPFRFVDINLELHPQASLPISSINKTRREAIEDLIHKRKEKYKREIQESINTSEILKVMETANEHEKKDITRISVKVENLQQLKKIIEFPIDRIYYSNIFELKEAIRICNDKDIEIYYKSPSIIKDKEEILLKEMLQKSKPDGILVGELGVIDFSKTVLHLPVIADISLNIMNSSTIAFLYEKGINGITLSTELDIKNMRKLKINKGIDVETIIYGKLPVMITETCPMTYTNQCDCKCEECKIKPYQYLWGLKDEKKAVFPITKDDWGRSIIINSFPLYMIDKRKDLENLPITSYRLDFTNEDPIEVEGIMRDYFYNYQKSIQPSIENFTRGHYYRGVE